MKRETKKRLATTTAKGEFRMKKLVAIFAAYVVVEVAVNVCFQKVAEKALLEAIEQEEKKNRAH